MIDTSQVDRFASRLAASPDGAEELWQEEWKGRVADEMRSLAPVDTGALRASIQTTEDGVVVLAPYAGFVEYGTSDTAPQPFAAPAVNNLSDPAARDAGRLVVQTLT